MPKKGIRRGFGSTRTLKSGNVQARYTGPDGREHRAPTTFVDHDHAVVWLNSERRLISDQRWTPPAERLAAERLAAAKVSGPTLDQYVERVIARRRTRLHKPISQTTADLYRKDWRLRAKEPLGALPVVELTKDRVSVWWDALDEKTPTQNWRAYSLLKSVMRDAVEDGLATVDPCTLRGMGKPKPEHQGEALSAKEVVAYLAAVPDAYRVPLAVAVLCGLRSGEVRGLRRRDVDLGEAVIHIEQAVSRVRTGEHSLGWRFDAPKTAAGKRTVAMPAFLLPWVRAHLAALPLRGRDQLVFPAQNGYSPMGSTVLAHAHQKGVAAVERPEVRLHDLRRTAATLAAQGGATVKELMDMLGHTTPGVAMIYQKSSLDRDRQRAARLDAMLDDAM